MDAPAAAAELKIRLGSFVGGSEVDFDHTDFNEGYGADGCSTQCFLAERL